MQIQKLHKKLAVLDKSFGNTSIPFKERPLEALKAIHGSVRDPENRRTLFDPILGWYTEMYGPKVTWDGIMARVPVLVRGDLYLATIRFTEKDEVQDYRECIEDLPTEVSKMLGIEDFKNIASYTSRAQMYFNSLHTLQADDCFLSKSQRELMHRARCNLRISPIELKANEDTQGSIFSSHAAAEKFLKAALIGLDKNANPQGYRHGADKVFADLMACDPRFQSLSSAVDALQANLGQNMQIRYGTLSRSAEQAISIFYAALNICSSVANILRFDDERGSRNSAFRSGTYYVNSVNLSFWCMEASTTTATLVVFDTGTLRQFLPKVMKLKQTESGYYLQISDVLRIAALGHALSRAVISYPSLQADEADETSHMRNIEGSYTLGFSRRKLK